MNRACAVIVVAVLMLAAACTPSIPNRYIQPDDMEDILVDYFVARALAQHRMNAGDNVEYNKALYTEAVLRKYGYTQEQFDSSLAYYYMRADRFDDICERVSDRLEEQALVLGASEGEIGKYAAYNATGDTANIWPDRKTAWLAPMPPFNRWDFTIEGDSTFRKGDALLMMFMTDYMYQAGEKKGMLYIAVEYDDTVVSRSQRYTVSGLSQLRVPEDTTRVIKGIRGFFYLDGADEQTTTTRLLFLNNVQFIRFHTKHEEDVKTDSVARDSVGGQLPADTVGSPDSLRSGLRLQPVKRGDAGNGVDAGRDSAQTR